jgi:transcriptional regulator with XRE-family HTH domain
VRLREARQELGWTIREAAEKIGDSVTPSGLCQAELADFMPKLAWVAEIAKTYGVSLDWICGLWDAPKKRQP